MKVTLVIPAFNEIEGMKAIMPRIKPEWYDQLIILDGGSTDGTLEYARANGYFVYIQQKRGLRNAYMEIYDLIKGDIVITFSPDGNSIPEILPLLVQKMKEGYDMVIASRYLDGARSYDDDMVTRFGNWMFTFLINTLYGGNYTDTFNMYRAYRKDLIKKLELDKESAYWPEKCFFTRLSWEPLLSVRCARKKLKLAEIPGDEPPRIGGERKLQVIRWGAGYLAQVLTDLFLWR